MSKNILRREIKEIRDSLTDSEIDRMSSIITEKFLEKYSHLNVFLLYYPLGNEVNTISLISKLNCLNKEIYLPVINGLNMEFRKFSSFFELRVDRYGILEPTGNLLNVIPDVMCVPGIVFDEECYRIGYGGGFYDRYLTNKNNCFTSALAYDFQIVKKIETESFDIPVNEIFTDKRIINRRK